MKGRSTRLASRNPSFAPKLSFPACRLGQGRGWHRGIQHSLAHRRVFRRTTAGGPDRLHLALQAAFGWTNSHLFQFLAGEGRWGILDPDGDFGAQPTMPARRARSMSRTSASSRLKTAVCRILLPAGRGPGKGAAPWRERIAMVSRTTIQ
ncbi:IS1096 element passenger TnpR family protein [Bradyrhizobium shewense]|uniref:IS1096 element passenger TnpR family protein n=1 Tax=Bradyrhizobium shewense TaxID=1761772 RepID=UPI000B854E2B|nr:hypothetical protein [Bradyrhizobium shewense]